MVHVSYYTDPLCPWSWAAEPAVRRLEVEFGGELRFTYVMAGMARELDAAGVLASLLDAVAASGMPADPRGFLAGRAPRSSFPACLAVKAAAEQGLDGPCLRRLREGAMVGGERLDGPEALIAAARDVDGLDVARFEIDLRSHAILEAFGADRERAREAGCGGERPSLPAFSFDGGPVVQTGDVRALREAALAAGAVPGDALPDLPTALRRLAPAGAAELAAACGLAPTRARVELWALAGELRARPAAALCGELWEPA